MKRYEFQVRNECPHRPAEHPDGEWVRYEDVRGVLDAAEKVRHAARDVSVKAGGRMDSPEYRVWLDAAGDVGLAAHDLAYDQKAKASVSGAAECPLCGRPCPVLNLAGITVVGCECASPANGYRISNEKRGKGP